MFNTVKHLVLGATLLATAGWAQAYTVTMTPQNSVANLHLTESSSLGALSMSWYPIQGQVADLPGATLTKTYYGYAPSAVDLLLSAPISAITFDVSASSPSQSGGSQLKATQFNLSGGLSLTIGSNRTEITNLSIDLTNKQILGDIRSGDVVQTGVSVWSIDSVQGPASLRALDCDFTCDFASTYLRDGYLQNRYLDNLTLTGLRMTQQATDLLLPGLASSPFASMYEDYAHAPNWANQLSFSTLAVPEAGTSLMMLLGLGGLGLMARKKQAKAANTAV